MLSCRSAGGASANAVVPKLVAALGGPDAAENVTVPCSFDDMIAESLLECWAEKSGSS